MLWGGFIIQMEHYNGLYSDSIQIAACSQLGLLPISFNPLPTNASQNVFMMYTCKNRNGSENGHLETKDILLAKHFAKKRYDDST